MFRTLTGDRESTAFHKAGHAVMALLSGIFVFDGHQ